MSLAFLVGKMWPEGGKDASPLLAGHLLAAVAAPCDRCDVIACDAAEALGQARRIPPCEPGLDDEPGRVPGVARPVEQDNGAAHRVPEDDRPGYRGGVAEGADVVSARLEASPGCVAPGRPAMPAQIEVDDLSMPR